MMPYGSLPTGSFCTQCGCPTGMTVGMWPGQVWPGTYAPTLMPSGPGFGYGGPGGVGPTTGFGPGMGFGGPWFDGAGWGAGPFAGWTSPVGLGWGLGGLRRWGGTYTPQFMLTGLPTDDEIAEMVYDAIDADPLIPFDADINVECDAGTVTLTGTVPTKQIKHAAGDDAWWIPGVDDVRNEIQVVSRRATRGTVEQAPAPPSGRPSRVAAARR